ncbi:MAG: protein-methionine-sulfoxide reductase catalytic subunit MsrP [Granulosicoccaceae bacterium]|jgi:sulfoxide reductase catalytic subunit YedY
MLIKIRKPGEIRSSEITDEKIYHQRRRILQAAGLAAGSLAAAPARAFFGSDAAAQVRHGRKLENVVPGQPSADLKPNSFEDIASYNNFYEFATDKRSPAILARDFKTTPWTVRIDGEVEKPGTYQFEDIIRPHQLEERIYRLRCVEAWSMVVPWVGIPLASILKQYAPTSKAKYVAFETLYDPKQMPGQRRRVLDWPYVEGLRIDEAMHPLTMLVVGLYGEVLPNQNGAPLRLIVPWKYGFKSIKSIVGIHLTEQQPPTTWNRSAPNEYGFYANVNPDVDHPRWSQARERVLGKSFFAPKKPTLMFNGYADEVASLYSGMDLRKHF